MKKTILFNMFFLMFCTAIMADDIFGFWNTIDDETGKAQSIVAIYPYKDKVYGRMIATYGNNGKVEETLDSPKEHAPGVVGNPFYVGMDFIWDLEKNGDKYINGTILDPEKGKEYDAEMWLENGKLKVRGEVWVFGRNETWVRPSEEDFPKGFKKPDYTKFVPKIPEVKKEDN